MAARELLPVVCVLLVALLAGCLLPRLPHGLWNNPAVEIRGQLSPKEKSRVDSVRVVRAHYSFSDHEHRDIERRIANVIAGDTLGTNEYLQVRTVAVNSDGSFVATFPPVLHYGALYPGEVRTLDETIFVRLPSLAWEALAIPLDPPYDILRIRLDDWRHRTPSEDIIATISGDGVTEADTSGLLTIDLDIE